MNTPSPSTVVEVTPLTLNTLKVVSAVDLVEHRVRSVLVDDTSGGNGGPEGQVTDVVSDRP
jgi:hypothetical protein